MISFYVVLVKNVRPGNLQKNVYTDELLTSRQLTSLLHFFNQLLERAELIGTIAPGFTRKHRKRLRRARTSRCSVKLDLLSINEVPVRSPCEEQKQRNCH